MFNFTRLEFSRQKIKENNYFDIYFVFYVIEKILPALVTINQGKVSKKMEWDMNKNIGQYGYNINFQTIQNVGTSEI